MSLFRRKPKPSLRYGIFNVTYAGAGLLNKSDHGVAQVKVAELGKHGGLSRVRVVGVSGTTYSFGQIAALVPEYIPTASVMWL